MAQRDELKESLYRAIRNENLQDIELIFQRQNGRISQNLLNDCLFHSCKTNNLDLINYFIDAGAQITDTSVFFFAFCVGNIDIVNRLLEIYRPDINILNDIVSHIISENCDNKINMIRKLVQEGADVNYMDGAPIFAACRNNNTELVNVLLDLGANPNIERNGENCLNYAVQNLNVDMIRRLFEAEVIILPSVDLDIALRQGMAWLNPDININFEAIIDTVSELVRHGVKPKILDITSTLVFYEVGDITIPQFEQLLALLLSERISLPARTIEELRAAQQRGVQIDLQNVVPFTEQEEEKYALQAQQNAEDAGMDMSESEDSDFEENMQELERNGGRSLRNIRGLNAIANIREEIEEQNAERNTAENRARARQIEAENEAKRQAALEEYKTTDMEAQPAEVKVNANCYPVSHTTIMGDALKDTDDFVVFLIERSEKGDCYLRSELEEIYARPVAYEFRGAPYGVSIPENMRNMPRGPDENKPVFKLPWTNIWVTKGTIVEAINTYNNLLILKGKRQSIGSDYGNSMDGQFGGHWREENGRAIYVESGDAQPDERPMVYTLMRGVYSQL